MTALGTSRYCAVIAWRRGADHPLPSVHAVKASELVERNPDSYDAISTPCGLSFADFVQVQTRTPYRVYREERACRRCAGRVA